MCAELLLPRNREDLADDAVLVRARPEPLAPVMDEEIAEDDALARTR
jgi:hypothetical protein